MSQKVTIYLENVTIYDDTKLYSNILLLTIYILCILYIYTYKLKDNFIPAKQIY